jgi:hypothetical protein
VRGLHLETSNTAVWLEGGLFATVAAGILALAAIDLCKKKAQMQCCCFCGSGAGFRRILQLVDYCAHISANGPGRGHLSRPASEKFPKPRCPKICPPFSLPQEYRF